MSTTHHAAVRLEDELVARLDALIPSLSMPWKKATRSDAIRAAILAGLPLLETPPTPASPSRKRGAR